MPNNLAVFILLASTIACSSETPGFHGDTARKALDKTQDSLANGLPAANPSAPADEAVAKDPEAATTLDPSVEITLDTPVGESNNNHELIASTPDTSALPDPALSDNSAPKTTPPAIKAPDITIEVKLSGTEVREGGKTIQAQALLTGTAETDVVWSLEGATGGDLGTIDSSGKYTSPGSIAAAIVVNIVATLASDSKVTAKKSINVIPIEQLFVGCKKGNVEFPISADVFQLPVNTTKLPNFASLTKSDVVCLDKFDIPQQSWELGFPGATNLQEWFALHTASKLIIPSDGSYSFMITSDDGANVYLNGTKLIDNDGNHAAKSATGTIALTAGKQDLVLDWYQGPRTQIALQLFWKTPGSTAWVIVPSSAFAAK